MTSLFRDLRYGMRSLRRTPGFTLIAVVTLALGIGANTAMFGIVDALLFRPPSGVAEPERLVRLQMRLPAVSGEPGEIAGVVSYPSFTAVRDRARGLAGAASYARSNVTVSSADDAEGQSEDAILASADYFSLLRVRAARGRLLGRQDDAEGAPVPSAVLSWDYWQRALSGDEAAIGSSILINGRSFTIVGVAPKHFVGTELGGPAMWLPLGVAPMLGYDAAMVRSSFASWLSVVARLAPGITREQAQASVAGALLAARDEGALLPTPGELGGGTPGGEVRVRIAGPGDGARGAPTTAPPPEARLTGLGGGEGAGLPGLFGRGATLPVSLWFLAVTGAVLLIACANVANLLIARATSRSHEIAIRLSLGATRARIGWQLMTESLLLAVMGGVAGVLLALGAVALLPDVLPLPPLPPLLDARALAFTTGLVLLTTLAFGLVPAIRTARATLQDALTASGRMRAAHTRGRGALVVVQLAASLVLLVGAGLFLRSLANVKAIDTGFDADRILLATVDLRRARLTREQADEFWRRALDRVRAIPGVRSAALGGAVPFEMNIRMPVAVPGSATGDQAQPAQADFAGPGYFSTLGIPIRQGRAFTDEDREGGAPVVIINEALARQHWQGESPIGQCIRAGSMGPNAPCAEVVGVAANARYADVTQEPGAFFYRPLAQRPRMAPPMTVLHLRTTGDPAAVAGAVRRELQGIDTNISFVSVRPLTDLIRPQTLPWRTGTLIFTLFGALGLLLAAVGLYGVLAFLVAQRTREIGVRMALGAQRRDVLALVLGQGTRLIAAGILAGAAGAAIATRLFASMMYGVSPFDPIVYVLTAAVLAAVGLLAVYVPARRAVAVDPVVALRAE
ncbi:MAG: ABC transporter permease [Gemmatimonadaceae bacterium]